MKKKFVFSIFVCFLMVTQVYASNYEVQSVQSNTETSGGVMCNKKMTVCTVGKHTLHSNTKRKPLYVRGGVVCNYKRNICTNGFTYMYSKKPIY